MKINLFILVMVCVASAVHAAPPAEEGKAIFQTRCAACHNINKDLTGPALSGVNQRRSMDWIVSFVQSSQTVIKSGDKDAIALFEKFNKIPMPDHRDLTAQDIGLIVSYIESASVDKGESAAPFKKPAGNRKPSYTPVTMDDYPLLLIFLASIIVLIASLLTLVKVKSLQREAAEKNITGLM